LKPWNLTPEKVKMSFGEMDAIVLGEKGRGRVMNLVACPDVIKEAVHVGTTQLGKPRVSDGHCPVGGKEDASKWLARITTKGPYRRGADGTVMVHPVQGELVKVVAIGCGAFGEAGRTGRWEDYIVTCSPGTVLMVRPTRDDPHFLLFTEERVHEVQNEELHFAENMLPKSKGWSVPEQCSKEWTRLSDLLLG
jgi:hypothetical protein